MPPFDAELHLRLLGERGLLDDPGRGRARDSPMFDAARALIAIGAIDTATATEIVEGYELASGLRNGEGMARWRLARGSNTPSKPEPQRIVLCHVTLERPKEEILVRSVKLSPHETRVNVLIRAQLIRAQSIGRAGRNRRPGPMAAMFSYPISDDRGNRGSTNFSGGGSETEWRGHLTSSKPLAVDTEWIELDGTRIELVDKPNASTVTVEPVEEDDPVSSYLWRWLATMDRHGPHLVLEPVLDALRLAGGLQVGEPLLAFMRQAAESRRFGGNSPHGPPPGPVDGVPAEWQSLLNPKPNHRTAHGTVAVVAITPPFDGFTVTVDELNADAQGWQLEVDISPGIMHGPFNRSLSDLRIAWWAVDDRGQYYLGQAGSFSSSPESASGTLEFRPALDAGAKTLVLLPTGPTEQARIEFPLDWSRL